MRTWRRDSFYCVAVGVIDRYHGNAGSELIILGQILCAIGSGAFLVSIFGWSNTLVECYKEYLGSGCIRGLLDYPTCDVRLFKRCLQKTASTLFATLHPFLRTEFIVTRFKGAEYRDWMHSRQSLRRSIETGDLFVPGLIDVVSNIKGVWPLIVFYLKESGKKEIGDSLLVWFSFFSFIFSMTATAYFRFHVKKKRIDGYLYINQLARMKFRLFHLIVEMYWFLHQLSRVCSIFQFQVYLMYRDSRSQSCSIPGCILIAKWLGNSRSQLVVLLVVSSFSDLVVRDFLLFQTTTIL